MSWNIELMLSSMFVYQDGWTSLMSAANAGKVEVVGLLLDRGADISAANKVPSSTKCFGLDYPGSIKMPFFCKAML